MQAPTPRRERRRPQISCTECRRRKQKCNFRNEGPCTNCMRRYPQVECYVQKLPERPRRASSSREKARKRDGSTGAATSPLSTVENVSTGEQSSSSRTSTPRLMLPHVEDPRRREYPPIPLSRILYPVSDFSRHTKKVVPIEDNGDASTTGKIIPEENKENITSHLQDLKFLDPGSREVMHKRIAQGGSPRSIGGMLSMLNSFNAFPLRTTIRNAELFNFYHQYVAPRLCSIDGGDFHPLFAKEILPWQVQSPLMPNIAILMAAATQSYLQNPETEMSAETLTIKSHVLALVNRFIRQDFDLVGNQALRIVIHLVIIEWWWGSEEALWSHMEGIKQMLMLRGGLQAMEDPLNMHVLIVTDYELACGYERDLYLQTTSEALSANLPIQTTYPAKFRCPILKYPTSFRDCHEKLGIDLKAAEILDDIRFLTTSITESMVADGDGGGKITTAGIRGAAAWMHTNLQTHPPPPPSPSTTSLQYQITSTIHQTALLYTRSISTLTPISHLTSLNLFSLLSLTPLTNWSSLPGIFLWILLVATPGAEGSEGRWLRKQMACTGMSISLEDFFLGTACLRGFWGVQVWVRREAAAAAKGNKMLEDVDG